MQNLCCPTSLFLRDGTKSLLKIHVEKNRNHNNGISFNKHFPKYNVFVLDHNNKNIWKYHSNIYNNAGPKFQRTSKTTI